MLKFNHVSVSVNHETILSDINLEIKKGTITTIIGPNGCGKTTLLQTLNGSSKVTAGEILLNGTDYLKFPNQEKAKNIAFLPQVRTIIPSLPVKTLVEHGRFPYLGFSRRKTREDEKIVQKALEFVGLQDYANQYVDTLSGGIRQRAFFAMVLAQDCDYIVLDEPTTYLDISGQREFLSLLTTLRAQGKTILLVLHDLNQALQISDHIIIMENRKIVSDCTPAECVENRYIDQIFHTKTKTFYEKEKAYYFFE